jgi:hypothetical protein
MLYDKIKQCEKIFLINMRVYKNTTTKATEIDLDMQFKQEELLKALCSLNPVRLGLAQA